MSHTPIMREARRALALATKQLGLAVPARTALSRRQALLLLAAGSAAACATRSAADPVEAAQSVAIVGGGVAGLTAAYRLASAGRSVTVYESSNRFGGRMFTRRNFTPEGQFCELGGELVDTNHVQLRALASELGVGVDPIGGADAHGIDLLYFGGVKHTNRDLLDPAQRTGDFMRLAERIAMDRDGLLDADENWTQHALDLDRMSLADYLDVAREGTPDWVIAFISVAYESEYGLPLNEQSSLNLIDLISADPAEEFSVFGESDEAWRIRGGSSSLPDALEARLSGEFRERARLLKGRALVAIARSATGLALTFEAAEGKQIVEAEQVILALPFSRLRTVAGIDAIGLSPEKLKAIREIGYGVNSKVMTPTSGRPWTSGLIPGEKEPVAAIYTDAGFQLAWDTSRGQPGPLGILTNFLTGEPARGDQTQALATLARGLAAISPTLSRALLPAGAVSFFWPRHPHTLGSYSSAKVGQYTSLIEATAAPELDGRLHFAGEHTSAEFLGYMNGAVESGERVAQEVLGVAADA